MPVHQTSIPPRARDTHTSFDLSFIPTSGPSANQSSLSPYSSLSYPTKLYIYIFLSVSFSLSRSTTTNRHEAAKVQATRPDKGEKEEREESFLKERTSERRTRQWICGNHGIVTHTAVVPPASGASALTPFLSVYFLLLFFFPSRDVVVRTLPLIFQPAQLCRSYLSPLAGYIRPYSFRTSIDTTTNSVADEQQLHVASTLPPLLP